MIVTVAIVGDKEVVARLESMSPVVGDALYTKITALSLKLEGLVKTGKLNGQVLNRITGALARSIMSRVERLAQSVFGYVFSSGDVKYAGIHEYGGHTSPHVIEPKRASVLAFMGKEGKMVFTKRVNHPGSKMPERSFMRSSLTDMSTEISEGMKEAVVMAVQRQIKGTA